MRYFCYLSKGKVAQLYDQISELSDATETYQVDDSRERGGKASVGWKGLLGGDIETSRRRGFTAALTGQRSAVQKLGPLLDYIEQNEVVANLNSLCRQGPGTQLDAFAYTYGGSFRVLGEVSTHSPGGEEVSGIGASRHVHVNRHYRDTPSVESAVSDEYLLVPAIRENAHTELTRINGGGKVVSDIAILLSDCEEYTISLSCSYKYFSDMGHRWDFDNGELDAHPHSGNSSFFRGEVTAYLEGLIFINGVRSKTIFGSPLFLTYSSDGSLRL